MWKLFILWFPLFLIRDPVTFSFFVLASSPLFVSVRCLNSNLNSRRILPAITSHNLLGFTAVNSNQEGARTNQQAEVSAITPHNTTQTLQQVRSRANIVLDQKDKRRHTMSAGECQTGNRGDYDEVSCLVGGFTKRGPVSTNPRSLILNKCHVIQEKDLIDS